MSDDFDFDMEVVEEDELDELGTYGASSSEDRSLSDKGAAQRDELEMDTAETGGLDSSESVDTSDAEETTSKEAPAEGSRGGPFGFKELPEDWNIGKVGSFAEVQVGHAFKSSEFSEDGVPIVRMSDLEGGRLNLDESEKIPHELAASKEDYALREGDTLVGMSGSIEKYAVVEEEDLPSYLNQRVGRFIVSDDALSRAYIPYLVQSKFYRDQIKAMAAGAAQKNVSKFQIEKVSFPHPPLPEQRKIASVLYAVDQAIQKTEAIIEQADRVLRGLMDDIFEKGVGSIEEYHETPVGRFPSRWEIGRIRDIVTSSLSYGILKPGKHNEDGVRMIRATDISHGRLVEPEPNRVDESIAEDFQRTRLSEGDVILSVMGTVGRSMCVPSSLEGANVNRALAVLKIDKGKVLTEFIDYWFRSPHIQSYFETQKFGTAQPRLNLGFLNKMKVPIPKLEEQEQIVDILGEVDDKYWKEKQIHSSLKRLKKGLMQDLLTGKDRTADKAIEVLDEVKAHG